MIVADFLHISQRGDKETQGKNGEQESLLNGVNQRQGLSSNFGDL
jgi:hypothetical protein